MKNTKFDNKSIVSGNKDERIKLEINSNDLKSYDIDILHMSNLILHGKRLREDKVPHVF